MSDMWKQWEGQVVDGQFTLGEFLGRSDHSAVFRTTYGPYSQVAALKFVEANPATAQAQLARWERAAKLQHLHLLRLFHWGRCQLGHAWMLYVVTELADENLGQILPSRALTPSETEYMLRSVLEVLGYLHAGGFVHGRVKPGNIMAVGDDLRLSCDTVFRAGEKDGMPHQPTVYDAPELATTGSTPAADIWSLGITLVECLTQKASPAEAVRQGDPTLPETIPAPFLEIARQCLRLDSERRWSVPDIAARLLPTAVTANKPSRAGYVVAGIAILCLAALVAVPKLLHQDVTATKPATPPGLQRTEPLSYSASGNRAPVPKETSKPDESKPAESAPSSAAPAQAVPPASKEASVPSHGSVADRVLPKVSRRSLDTITGKVKVTVRVAVDSAGKVSSASLQQRGPSDYFAKVALEASRRWKFTPPQQPGGEPGASTWLLHYAFGRAGVEVHPAQVSP